MAANKMDWQKNLLIAAMIAVLFMLAIRWNDFQENHVTSQNLTTENSVTAGSSSSAINDIPALPNEHASDSDTPTVLTPTSTHLINVSTDSLDVVINPLRGDIVHLALPYYPAELDTPDVPYVLLNNQNNYTYLAQSGLIGENGTDTSAGRPLF